MPRSQYIDFDPEKVPLEIHTNSVLGSDEYVLLYFKNAQIGNAGGIYIKFSSPPQYYLLYCSHWTDFPSTLPSATQRTWRITVDKGNRVMIHCNGVEVVNFPLSDQTCTYYRSWGQYWSKDVKKIYFSPHDTASDFYKPYTGN